MRFFDYKFLILLGLTLVIYLIYREVEYIRNKLEKLENEVINKRCPVIEPKLVNDVLPFRNSTPPKTSQELFEDKINQILEESDSEDNETLTDSSKHLEIYSNDNDQFDSVQNSLLESIEANNEEANFDYHKMDIPNLENTMENIMNCLSSESDGNTKQEEKQLSELSNSSGPKSKIKYDHKTLNNMKIPEIKKIAEKYNIILTKKNGGVNQKPKTKNELITELLDKIKDLN